MSRVIQWLKQAGRWVNQRGGTPVAQGLLALANAVASFACFRASKKPLYRVCGALLAVFSTYHVIKVIQAVKRRWAR